MLLDHAVVHDRFLERRQVLALEVLDDRDLERRVVVELFDERRDRVESGGGRRPPAALTGDQLVAVGSLEGTDEDGLQDAVLANRSGQLVQRALLEAGSRLVGVGLDPVDWDLADAERLG